MYELQAEYAVQLQNIENAMMSKNPESVPSHRNEVIVQIETTSAVLDCIFPILKVF